ncbi:MAG: DEAD/DEAH box helicase [Nitrososphaerota archaeon]|nr:DEAD/DEAH box helicase [Candidatus Calditenuis fumarioli]
MIRIEDLGLPEGLTRALRNEGVQVLYPHQEEAIRRGLLEGRNMVVTAPTASGKTLLAMLAAHRAISSGRKVLYLTPLRALTSEKLEEFSKVFRESGLGVRVRAVSGDYDDPGEWLAEYDLIVSTYEKADSLVRHGASWLGSVGLVVVDEVHMIGDRDRGPTLEMTVAKLQEACSEPSFLCLSATVRNGEELAGWLDAELIRSDFRPVPLIEGVFAGGRLLLSDGTTRTLEGPDPLMELVAESLRDGGQVLVFAMTRKRAEEYAARIAGSLLETGDDPRLEEYAREVLEERESPFSERLSLLIRRGVAFHHAGLSYHHRRTVEEAFRSRALRVLCSTTTLAAGVNLPARTVIIPEYRKFRGPGYVEELTVMEYKQLSGRAGRPQFDRVGYAILMARHVTDLHYLFEKYVRGLPERIVSSLASDRHLRSHVLSLIASGIARTETSLFRVLSRTFFAHQFGARVLLAKTEPVLEFLESHGMITRSGTLEVTPLGRRVSELYIDPLTAVRLLEIVQEQESLTELGALLAVSLTPDMRDVTYPAIHRSKVESMLDEHADQLPVQPPDPFDDPEGYELFLDAFALSLLLRDWINEVPEREIYERYRIEPGDFAALRERAEWISYAAGQVMRVVGRKGLAGVFAVMSDRIRHGVRSELLELVTLPEIGRVRARALWSHGIRSVRDVAEAPLERLTSVPGIGQRIAERIKEHSLRLLGPSPRS